MHIFLRNICKLGCSVLKVGSVLGILFDSKNYHRSDSRSGCGCGGSSNSSSSSSTARGKQ